MTLSPFTSRLVKPRPDLPAYELNPVCAEPWCARQSEDNHHVLNRGMGWPKKSDFWWAELPDGITVPVRLGLCREHHAMLTEHTAKLEWDKGWFAWYDRTVTGWRFVGAVRLPVAVRHPLPYVCLDCGHRAPYPRCASCLGECVPVAESPVGREDRLAAEGHA